MSLRNLFGAIEGTPIASGVRSAVERLLGPLNQGGEAASASTTTDPGSAGREFSKNTVFLNLYDITEVNDVLYHAGLGVHHTGVEVYGMEFAFGRCPAGTGVFQVVPKLTPPHIFREQLVLGETRMTQEEVLSVVKEFKDNESQWSGRAYHLVRNNCNHFSEAFAGRLLPPEVRAEQHQQRGMEVYDDGRREEVTLPNGQVLPLPSLMPRWINRLARNAARFMPTEMVERMDALDRAAQRMISEV
ncbi:hypothetical protein TraAM80_01275 [Trypanosoma rangeli]|uniref:PPPDE domain-containing protein n=1 Tax=Trypanosoma rangeli TaxID=5698 RepID=A0A422NZN2_TRYRA|nr:uncharacterized protein TraAM80_01275 [Trypanosoma rangeli]RNF10891.1 hypothetical protein TraAM80_01275 [Trypanosoma rangeli]|eukprot:RNF10891.1 hypothetical protein TraAM80_01275 [Trypanosoma rangeli]